MESAIISRAPGSGDWWHRCSGFRGYGCVCPECAPLSAPDACVLSVETHVRTIASASRKTQPRHHFRGADSLSIKIVVVRAMVIGLIGGAITPLMPLVARYLLHAGARTYGAMLSAFGLGAVLGALAITEVRKRMTGEAAIRACSISMGGAVAAAALSREPISTAAALVLAGAVWIMAWMVFSIGVQLSAQRWVAGPSAITAPPGWTIYTSATVRLCRNVR